MLHHAAYNARLDVVTELLARGADVHATVSSEALQAATGLPFAGSALHIAAASLCCALACRDSSGGDAAMFATLAPAHADAAAASARRVAVVEALLAAGADISRRAPTAPAGAADPAAYTRLTPLVIAAQYGDAAVIAALLRAGAAVDAPEPCTGMTALHFAVHGGHTDAVYALLAGGADANRAVPGNAAMTPLHRAVMQNKHGAVRALLEAGADTAMLTVMLSRPPPMLLPVAIDATTRALVARHVAGNARPARACALPACEARRRVDYDDRKLMACPCKARMPQAAQSSMQDDVCALTRDARCSVTCAAGVLLLQGAPAGGPQAPQGGVQGGAGGGTNRRRRRLNSARTQADGARLRTHTRFLYSIRPRGLAPALLCTM